MKKWKITYMTDYPYSDSIVVNAETEEDAWKKFEEETRYKRNEYSSIEKLN